MVQMKECEWKVVHSHSFSCFKKAFILSAKFTACMAELYLFSVASVSSAFSYHVFYLLVEAIQLHQLL